MSADRTAPSPAAKAFREAFGRVFGKSSQCGDCGGTRKVDGKPCRICCPTDDGPEKDEK